MSAPKLIGCVQHDCAECRANAKTIANLRRAVIDLASRGYGCRRPDWLTKIIDAAIAKEQAK